MGSVMRLSDYDYHLMMVFSVIQWFKEMSATSRVERNPERGTTLGLERPAPRLDRRSDM